MKRMKILLAAALSLSLVAALLSLGACSTPAAVAATVNGTEILEQDITDTIEAMRTQNEQYSDPATWAKALAGSGLTPESLRESVIDSQAQQIIVTQEAEAQGFSVDEATIDETVAQTRTQVGAEDDASWLSILQQYGYKDEQAYRDTLVISNLTNQLYAAFEVEPTDEELIEFIAQNPKIVEGYTLPALAALGISNDVVATDDTAATDDAVVEDTAATDDSATAEDTAATDDAAVDDTAATDDTASQEDDVVTVAVEDVDLAEIPEDILAQFKEQWVLANKGLLYQEWFTELTESAEIVINEMPADVPYNVDMSLAETSTDDSASSSDDVTANTDYSSAESVASAVASGLVITDDTVGDGTEAVSGSTVRVNYVGTLEDGTEFDSNTSTDAPFEFTLGKGSVIRGWDAGVVGMKVGGTRTLTIPASLAYGSTGQGSIPADATLTFEVTLVEVVQN